LKLKKLLKVLIIEMGMLGGIVIAGYSLPDNTPLITFIIASAAVFVLGNVLMIRRLRMGSYAAGRGGGPWPHILPAFAILAVCWILILILRRF
jgi:hypothetical protein